MNKNIYCYADWDGLNGPCLIGVLHSEQVRGKEIFRFDYDESWLKDKNFRLLDPDLGKFSGAQYLHDDKINFGMFLDSSPDRWGRTLIKRREAILARKEGREVRKLYESDYLLGVYDGTRMGALRFKVDPTGSFLDDNASLATPPWSSIRDLEYACAQYENNIEKTDYNESEKWLNMLFRPGSSLGGARPKANVRDTKNNLWIVKFPSQNDKIDMGAWENLAANLAVRCGINYPEHGAQAFLGKQHSFYVKRFDRTHNGTRIQMASAMTLLGYSDGDNSDSGVSYLELAEFITRFGSNPEKDLPELWRRIAFCVAISNTDDHLRNHAFLLENKGWRLSPAYDINPNPDGGGLKLNINGDDNALDFELVVSVSKYFRINNAEAKDTIKKIKEVVSGWRGEATRLGISSFEQDQMSSAFLY
ncbi:MAG: HipA domain-containing protein [Bacteroidales bacterium]|nr:HipA domain-containing protein [Bacteroidales bacterium]